MVPWGTVRPNSLSTTIGVDLDVPLTLITDKENVPLLLKGSPMGNLTSKEALLYTAFGGPSIPISLLIFPSRISKI